MRVTVVGAGIVGLTCALRLSEAGHAVRVVTAEPPERTTSAIAAALWWPYRAAPEAQVRRWAARGLVALGGLAGVAGSGVRVRAGRELLRAPLGDPGWRASLPGLRRLTAAERTPAHPDGFGVAVPVVDTGRHLPWLVGVLAGRGVAMELRRVDDLRAVDGDVAVNCTGLGAGPLARDPSLLPVRGQVVVVDRVRVDEWVLDEAGPTYVVPREDTVVLGGTAEDGRVGVAPDPATARRIVERCAALVPAVAGARLVAHRVGLRPVRPAVRLEAADDGGRRVVHCYGHGGAGVTLAHGCADDVVALVDGA